MGDTCKKFDRREWNKRMSQLIKEHPALGQMTGTIQIDIFTGDVKKTSIVRKIV